MKTHLLPLSVLVAALGLAGCGAQQGTGAGARAPTAEGAGESAGNGKQPVRQPPPPSGPVHATPFPKISRDELPNGIHLDVVPIHTLPLVQIRVLIRTGTSLDGNLIGLGSLTGHMLMEGGAGRFSSRDLRARLAGLGTEIGVEVGPDATTLSVAVTRTHFDEMLDLLGAIVREPRWDAGEFTKLKKRQSQRAADRAKSSGTWAATMLLWRDLYQLPTGMHPYAAYEATPGELARIKVTDCRDHYRKNYSPKNSVVVVAGDVDLETSKRGLERAFGAWKGPEPNTPSFSEAIPPEHPRILLADRPKSPQSDLYIAMLGPERSDETWTDAKVANQILGGGVSGRLLLDVRDKRSLATVTRSSLGELAHGPVPLAVYAAASTANTAMALQALLEDLRKLATEPPSDEELNVAKRYLSDVFAIKMETSSSIADMVAALETLGLDDEHYDTYRQRIGEVGAKAAFDAAAATARDGHWVIAVAGDAEKIGPALSHFGDVFVYSPEKDFQKVRTIPANPLAPIEIERPATP